MPGTIQNYEDMSSQRANEPTVDPKMDEIEDIFDDLLNLEDKYYNEGYNEGYSDGQKIGFLEGKEYGIQTGFQRFIDYGILQGRLAVWQKESSGANERQLKRIQQLQQLLPDLIAISNDDADVEDYELRMKKAISKAKTMVPTVKGTPALRLDESLVGLRREEETIEDGY